MLIGIKCWTINRDWDIVIEISITEDFENSSLEGRSSVTMGEWRKNRFNVLQDIRLNVCSETAEIVRGVKQISGTRISKVWIWSDKRFTILNHNLERSLEVGKVWVKKLIMNVFQVLSFLNRRPSGLCRNPILWWLILKRVWVNRSDAV